MSQQSDKLDLLKEVALGNLNGIPAAKSGDTRAFIEVAVNWFGKWWKLRPKWPTVTTGYCSFVLNHEFASRGIPTGFTEKLLFRDAPSSILGGFVYVTDFSLSRVFCDGGGHNDADSICRKLKTSNLGTAPCVLFEPATGILLIGEQGVDGAMTQTRLTAFDGNLTVPNVDGLLTSFYDTALKFPETFPQIWWKKEKHVPMFQAEKLYQNLLFIYLRAHTQETWVVVREDQTNAGRTDLTLTSLNPTTTFVMELKVLKSFFFERDGKPTKNFSLKSNREWAESGIGQVCGYRTAKQAHEAFLILYDMRKKHAALASVVARCGTEKILLRKFDIFNATARDVRATKPARSKTR